MSKEQVIDEVYKNYSYEYEKGNAAGIRLDDGAERIANVDEFIRRIRADYGFSEKWGLKIEERELSLLERYELMKKLDNWISVHYKEPKTMEYMGKHNIPTKLITTTYKDTKIESYA